MTYNEIEVTIYDDKDNVISQEVCKCFTATQDEIDRMVQLIDHGMPAHIAGQLIKNNTL